jgi:predicted Zn-dependent protease
MVYSICAAIPLGAVTTELCLADSPDNKKLDGINYISWTNINIRIGSAAAYPKKSERFLEWNKMVECDIEFDKSREWHVGTRKPRTHENDLLTVAMHEFGHCLGLDHSDVRGAVMEEFLEKGVMRRNLHEDDIMGRNRIYGSPTEVSYP